MSRPLASLISGWAGDGNANDIFGGNPGLMSTNAGFAQGRVGEAFSFERSTAVITIASAPLTDVQDSFTLEFWVLPAAARNSTVQSAMGTAGTAGQRYAIAPEHGGNSGPAGVGVSVGTDGISAFEHRRHPVDGRELPLAKRVAVRPPLI